MEYRTMMDEFEASWLLVSIVPLLILASLASNYRRARRWAQKVRAHGDVQCRSCGFVGQLLVRTLSAGNFSSSNLRLVCGKCNSSDWFVPEEDRLP
jgi:hypothetical protein